MQQPMPPGMRPPMPPNMQQPPPPQRVVQQPPISGAKKPVNLPPNMAKPPVAEEVVVPVLSAAFPTSPLAQPQAPAPAVAAPPTAPAAPVAAVAPTPPISSPAAPLPPIPPPPTAAAPVAAVAPPVAPAPAAPLPPIPPPPAATPPVAQTPVPPPPPPPPPEPEPEPKEPEYQGPRGGPITLPYVPITINAAIEEDASMSFVFKGKDINVPLSAVFKGVSIALMIMFIAFPMFAVKIMDNPFKSSSSALNATMGCDAFSGLIFPVLLFLIPLALCLAFFLKDKIPLLQEMLEDGLYKLAALICAGGAGFLVITAIVYTAVFSGSGTTVHPFAIGFILPLLLYAACGGIAYVCILSQNKILTGED